MTSFCPELVLVQKDSLQDDLTREILDRLSGIPVKTVDNINAPIPEQNADSHAAARRRLILTRFPGSFMKKCPGSGADICCNYFVINFALNCHLQCSYCVLQVYLDNPALTIFTNVQNLMDEVREKLNTEPDKFFRIGTGEMADSLATDDITCYSRRLVPFFAGLPNGILELKTKSNQIANLRDLEHGGRTVVSWSLNSKPICRGEEAKSVSLEKRVAAARKCQEWGYKIGFHFDPLIYYPGWEVDYKEAVKLAFGSIDPAAIAWVSLGALRFTPHLREMVRRRFPESRISYGEFVPGHHGKLRYFRPIREEMYLQMRTWIEEAAPGVLVYYCMENRTVWERSSPSVPRNTAHLSDQLDARVRSNP
jgi:spore photoproduct lyase